MSDISNNILLAIDILVDAKVAGLLFDKTVKGTIYSIENADIGLYQVRYLGNIFKAYAQDISKTYKVDDYVFIKIPEGDFSSKKVITGKVTKESLAEEQNNRLLSQTIPVSPPFDTFYLYEPESTYGVTAKPEGDTRIIWTNEGEDVGDSIFKQYADKYDWIHLNAEFITKFFDTHSQGNYGLEILFTSTDDQTVAYRLDFNSFAGDPYNFSHYTPQHALFKVQKGYLKSLQLIRLFLENFARDLKELYNEEGEISGHEEIDTNNIFVKNINLEFVEVQDFSKEPYYCYIESKSGTIINNRQTLVRLEAKLLNYGKALSNCQYQWYERDLSVLADTEDFDKAAGAGWMILGGKNLSTLELVPAAIPYKKQYKVIVSYGDVDASAEIELVNNDAEKTFHILQGTNNGHIELSAVSSIADDVIQGYWYFSLPDGTLAKFTEDKCLSIEIVRNKYAYITFYCLVDNLGIEEYALINSETAADLIVDFKSELDAYRYDANGDITYEDAERSKYLALNIAWSEGKSNTIHLIVWFAPDGQVIRKGTPFENDPIDPAGSMMENIWVDNNNILHYNIKLKYRINNINNTFTVAIEMVDGLVYRYNKEILFLKDGDLGTNGTTYMAAIRPCDEDGNKLAGFHGLVYENNEWTSGIALKCFVYKNGEPVTAKKIEWTPINILFEDDLGNLVEKIVNRDLVLVHGVGEAQAARYIKAEVSIDNSTVYAMYPIDTVCGSFDQTRFDTKEVPSYIKYSSSGVQPTYYKKPLVVEYDGTGYNTITTLDDSLIKIRDQYLDPVDTFIFEQDTIGVLQIDIDDTVVYHPIIMYLDTYGNEAINGWDGTSVDLGIDDEGNDLGRILAPQIGAGRKDPDHDNRFTGVVMGKDSGQKEIGLYGYQGGISTFGFLANGKGYIGAPSNGRIEFDGNKSTIKSASYEKDKTGLCFDLDDEIIDSPSFKFKGQSQLFIFKLANTSSSYFKIVADTEESDSKTVFYVGGNNYYLQSKGFKVLTTSSAGEGTKIDLSNGTITSYNFHIKTPYLTIESTTLTDKNDGRGKFEFNIGGNGSFIVKGPNPNNASLMKEYIAFTSTKREIRYDNNNYWNLKTGVFKISGTITAGSGSNIGGWTVNSDSISSSDDKSILYADGAIKLGNNFEVLDTGDLKIKSKLNLFKSNTTKTDDPMASFFVNDTLEPDSTDYEKIALRIESAGSLGMKCAKNGHIWIGGGKYVIITGDTIYAGSHEPANIVVTRSYANSNYATKDALNALEQRVKKLE